jgi:MFS family permease
MTSFSTAPLAAVISKQFFAGVNDTTAFIFALMAFAAGFVVRPFGALVFGRLGDMIGRKYTFLATIILMGIATFCVGLLPTYASIGIAAPIILVALRMLQGLALGGEYGGAATYVAEHAPIGKRGFHTSWIQSTATLGLLLSLLVVLGCRYFTGDQFEVWGWAYSVPAVDCAAGDFHLDSSEPARVARVPENERGRQNLQGADP